ncbi:hypothetical protein ROHU_001154 [Labeo rohita]|uniref:Uncharacterized protein n=1 Tax=Labeo rohita TaxID=84645 RepID=A0A498P1C1_LABRO|nr:hypothetical protein ROHU_001154 [Labeo rohita]
MSPQQQTGVQQVSQHRKSKKEKKTSRELEKSQGNWKDLTSTLQLVVSKNKYNHKLLLFSVIALLEHLRCLSLLLWFFCSFLMNLDWELQVNNIDADFVNTVRGIMINEQITSDDETLVIVYYEETDISKRQNYCATEKLFNHDEYTEIEYTLC